MRAAVEAFDSAIGEVHVAVSCKYYVDKILHIVLKEVCLLTDCFIVQSWKIPIQTFTLIVAMLSFLFRYVIIID